MKRKRIILIVVISNVVVAMLITLLMLFGPHLRPSETRSILPEAGYKLIKEADANQWPFSVSEVWLFCENESAVAWYKGKWYHINGMGSALLKRKGIQEIHNVQEILKPNPQMKGAFQMEYNGENLIDFTLGLCK